ncbi:MAG TPA: OmpH family outer membrane protein [Phycisphaerales bacterium]|nr:OmpH family outer membrane protein [Phycisphaerales bacterium]
MKTFERAMVYTTLAALVGVNVMFAAGRWMPSAAYARPMADEQMGPTNALTLSGDGGDVVLKADKKHVSFGDSPFQKVYSVAFVDTGRILNPLMNAQSLADERKQLGDELTAKDKDYRDQLNELASAMHGMAQDSPDFNDARDRGKKLLSEYQEWGKSAAKRRDDLEVQQMQKCYKELLNGVDVVAEKKGIDIVYRFIQPDKDFKALDGDGALTEIRLRTAVKCPKELDITMDVLEEMSLPTEEVDAQP